METRISPKERKLLEKLESEPVNVEFIGQEERTSSKVAPAPGSDEYIEHDEIDPN